MPNRKAMAFKGGTSLSKVFSAINRFSEDIDVTIDHRDLIPDIDPFDDSRSRNQRKRDASELQEAVRRYVVEVIAPHFQDCLDAQFVGQGIKASAVENGDELHVLYPSALDASNPYLKELVKLEFGGRNITDPKMEHEVKPILASLVPKVQFPVAMVDVLSGERTFWEKATLAHVECNKASVRGAERLSRHWYDLYVLADHSIGRSALQDRALLADVVKYKKVFYNSATANYDECLTGEFKLVPSEEGLASLRGDYEAMVSARMIYGPMPDFAEIVERLKSLTVEINAV